MQITDYCNQDASYESFTGHDRHVNPAYSAPITIKVRKTPRTKTYLAKNEFKVIDITEYMTETPIKHHDRLDGAELMSVRELVDFDGTTIGYIGFPKPPTDFAAE